MIGQLIWNHDRPDITFDTGALYGGLHRGDCFQCRVDERWLNVRLEYANDWVLIHSDGSIPIRYGVLVRI